MKLLRKIKKIITEWLCNKTVQNYGLNAIWMFAARASWVIAAFTVGIFVTRKLGPERFGILNYAMAWIGMFAIILDLGVTGIVQRDLVLHPEKKDRLLGNFAMFKGIQTVLMLIISGTVLSFSNMSSENIKLILILMAGYCTVFSTVISPYFFSVVKNKYEAGSQIISCIVYNGIRLCAVFFNMPLFVYALAEAILQLTYHFSLLYFYHKTGNDCRNWSFRIKEVFGLFLPAIPLSLSGIFSTIYSRTDILMLEHFRGYETVAFYSLASRFTLNLTICFSLLSGIFSTAVSSSKKVSAAEYQKQIHRFYFMLFWIMIPFFPVFWLLSPIIFRVLYGEDFITTASVFSIYVCSLPCIGLLNAFFWHCTIENKLILPAVTNGLGALINVFANWYMIQKMGVTGAAWSSVLSMPAGLILCLICTKDGRVFLKVILKSLFTLPSFRLNHSGT